MSEDIDRAAQMRAELALALGHTNPDDIPEWDDLIGEVSRLKTAEKVRAQAPSPRETFLRKMGYLK